MERVQTGETPKNKKFFQFLFHFLGPELEEGIFKT